MESKLFTPVTFGPLTLRNRTIRSPLLKACVPVTPLHKCCSITTARWLRAESG